MEHNKPQYKASYEFLTKLNDVVYKNNELHALFTHEDFDIWHAFSQKIFRDTITFKQTGIVHTEPRPIGVYLKDFFIGLFLFLSTVIAWALSHIKKDRVFIYGIDKTNSEYKSDFRFTEIYKALGRNNISYREIFHTIVGRGSITNFFKRRRFAYYLESFDWLFSVLSGLRIVSTTSTIIVDSIDLDSFSEEEKVFARYMLKTYIREVDVFKMKTSLLSWLLKRSSYRVLFTIDDARFYNEVLFSAKKATIRSYAFQHGHITKYQVGWVHNEYSKSTKCITPDTFVVWSRYWKEECERLQSIFDNESLLIGGVKEVISHNEKIQKDDFTRILIPYETVCPKDEVRLYIETLLECKRIIVIMKLRPDMDTHTQLAEYGLFEGFHERFEVSKKLESCIDSVSLVAGTYSTLLYDLIAYNKPIAILDTSLDYGEGMILNNLADSLNFDGNICGRAKTLSETPTFTKRSRINKLYGQNQKKLSKTLDVIIEKEGLRI